MSVQLDQTAGAEWAPPQGHYLAAVYKVELSQPTKPGQETLLRWGFVVLHGPHAGKRITDLSSVKFSRGGGSMQSKAYKWTQALQYKGAPIPLDAGFDGDALLGKVGELTYGPNKDGSKLVVGEQILVITQLPEGLTPDGIREFVVNAQAEEAEWVAQKAANGRGGARNAGGYGYGGNQPPTSDLALEDIPF